MACERSALNSPQQWVWRSSGDGRTDQHDGPNGSVRTYRVEPPISGRTEMGSLGCSLLAPLSTFGPWMTWIDPKDVRRCCCWVSCGVFFLMNVCGRSYCYGWRWPKKNRLPYLFQVHYIGSRSFLVMMLRRPLTSVLLIEHNMARGRLAQQVPGGTRHRRCSAVSKQRVCRDSCSSSVLKNQMHHRPIRHHKTIKYQILHMVFHHYL